MHFSHSAACWCWNVAMLLPLQRSRGPDWVAQMIMTAMRHARSVCQSLTGPFAPSGSDVTIGPTSKLVLTGALMRTHQHIKYMTGTSIKTCWHIHHMTGALMKTHWHADHMTGTSIKPCWHMTGASIACCPQGRGGLPWQSWSHQQQ